MYQAIPTFRSVKNTGVKINALTRVICCLLALCFICGIAVGQKRPAYDSNYFVTYHEDFIARLFLSEKYTDVDIKGLSTGERYSYHPNTNYVLGVGFTYRPLTINIGAAFGFLNKDALKGESNYIDVKSHIYSNKWVADIYAQWYKRFYAYPNEISVISNDRYYLRPDLKLILGGASAYRVLNNRRFSYRPTFIQDTWQKKSAGSLMIGLAAFYTRFNGDSSFAPSSDIHMAAKRNINLVNVLQFGPGAGYAYHLVLPLNLFIMGSINANLNLNFVTESGENIRTNQLSVNPSILYRAATGYSNGNWNVNLSVFNQQLPAKGASSGNKYIINTGNWRLNIAKRLHPGEKGKRFLRPISILNISPN